MHGNLRMPTGLLMLIALLACSFLGDVALLLWAPALGTWVLVAGLLVGRMAAIFGIILRTLGGWWLAVVAVAATLALQGIALTSPAGNPVSWSAAIVQAGCLVYLVTRRVAFST